MGYMLSHYKFAAKMIGEDTYIMDVGCNDGLGSVLLAEVAKKVIALDIDPDAIASAKRAFANKNIVFLNEDFLSLLQERNLMELLALTLLNIFTRKGNMSTLKPFQKT